MDIKINRQEAFKTAGYIGAALLISGYLRYSVQETMTTLNKALLIGGTILLIAGIALSYREIVAHFRRRSTRLGANTTVMAFAVLAILGMVNFLGYRHHKRLDLTAEKLYSLSDQSRKIAASLQKDVKVIKFDKTDDQELRDLMEEYRYLNKRISYEHIDPQLKPEVAKQFNVGRMGEVIVASDNRTERPQETNEQAITNALVKVTRDKLKNICFVEGHGEKDSSSSEPDGYGSVDRGLKDENYETKKVNLVSANLVPTDCDVLVEAGPKKELFPQEAAMIGKYLDEGGKALLLIDPDTEPGIGDVLRAWNVKLGNDTVLDVSGVGRLFGTGPAVPLARTYGSHPITKDFAGTMTFFPLARSVNKADNSKFEPAITELLKTSEESWAETELKGGEAKFDEGKDMKGPITIGVAASKKAGVKEARLVVLGDSDFAGNSYARLQRNGDLFLNAVNWLAQDEDLISIRPKSPTDRRVTLTASQQTMLFWFSLVLLPGLVFASGVYVWWKRR